MTRYYELVDVAAFVVLFLLGLSRHWVRGLG